MLNVLRVPIRAVCNIFFLAVYPAINSVDLPITFLLHTGVSDLVLRLQSVMSYLPHSRSQSLQPQFSFLGLYTFLFLVLGTAHPHSRRYTLKVIVCFHPVSANRNVRGFNSIHSPFSSLVFEQVRSRSFMTLRVLAQPVSGSCLASYLVT
jgi:hypothetical protein